MPEFGHALGFAHVQNCPDRPATCQQSAQGSNGDQMIGAWDLQSLMKASFGYTAGDWRVEKHPRTLADINGDGRADVIGFGNAGVYTHLN